MKIRFYLFLVLLILVFNNSIWAQNFGASFIVATTGLSIPNLTAGKVENDWNQDYDSRQGLYFSLFVEYQLSRFLFFQPGLAYAAEGGA